jgi:ABC-type multidrug transport system permease subunit
MFDKMIIMDTGGYPVYYGSPVEAVTYFKKATHQVDSNRGQCEICGNVNPEQIFNIVEAKVVDEYGQATSKRKITPPQWHDMYLNAFETPKIDEIRERPPQSLNLPSRLKQAVIFATRDVLAKISNKQYLLINLLEAPLLAAILAVVIRYTNSPDGTGYMYRYNENIPAFILMSIIVALFMGLTVSAEEIIRDRKILKRESFLNLSWNSYLLSKISILFALSAIQAFLFILVGHFVLEIKGMTAAFWLILFSTSCFANILGLNVSSAFNSAVTVYVIIPLLLIPQMILSGALFSFDKLNDHISTKGKTPIVADMMASRWAYEALSVYAYRHNEYQRHFFEYEKNKSIADFKAAHLADELLKRAQFVVDNHNTSDDSVKRQVNIELSIINETLKSEIREAASSVLVADGNSSSVQGEHLITFLKDYKAKNQAVYNQNAAMQEKKMNYYQSHGWDVNWYKDRYFNQTLSDMVRNVNTMDRMVEYNGKMIQLIDPIYQEVKPSGLLDYRAPFFASEKNFLGTTMDTFYFNAIVLWIMSGLLYLALYRLWLRKAITHIDAIHPFSRKPKQTTKIK